MQSTQPQTSESNELSTQQQSPMQMGGQHAMYSGQTIPPGFARSARGDIRKLGEYRSPVSVILLTIITLGIYQIIFGYKCYQEINDWRGSGWSGGTYLLFTFLIPIAGIVTPWLLPSYIGKLYAEEGKPKPISGYQGFWLFLPIIGVFIWLFGTLGALNRFWSEKSAGM